MKLYEIEQPTNKSSMFTEELTQSKEKRLEKLPRNLTTLLSLQVNGTFSTGINIRNLHNIVFASPSKSRIRNLQSIGRGLRLKDDNSAATLYDIADDISYNGKENYTLQHFKERINIYNGEDFNYEIHNVELINGSKNTTKSD